MAAAVGGNKVFFAGGDSYWPRDSGPVVFSNVVDIYDISANTWTRAQLSEPRADIAAATAGNKVLFAGGYRNSKVDIYDASSNSWTTALLSQPRIVSSTATLGNKVLFFTGDPNYNRMDIYDASANTWSTAELNKSLYSIPIVAGNQVFIGGGEVHTIGTYADRKLTSKVWKFRF
ncbi:MAG: hypothetical protein WKI04_14615 [Ferruginibacter sp.]